MNSTAPGTTVRTFSLDFLRAYITTMRPYLLFVSGITGVAGASFAPGPDDRRTLLVLLASFLSYGFGQALTDCFQTDTDALSAPYRPLTRGIIVRRQVFAASLAGLIACITIFAKGHPFTLVLGFFGVVGLVLYTWFKRRWWGGPFFNALIVVNLALIAFVAASRSTDMPTHPGYFWMFSAVFWGYANFVLAGYFKDIEADRATGYNTFPVVFGRKAASFVSDCLAIVAVGSTVLAVDRFTLPAVLFLVSGICLCIIAQVRLHRNTEDRNAHAAIVPVVHAYICLLSAIAVSCRGEWLVPLLLFYAAFVFTMHVRPAHDQI